jgi:TonB family protein
MKVMKSCDRPLLGQPVPPVLRAAIVVVLALASARALADLKAAATAYEAGDFQTAHREFRSLAELGDPVAQYNLGILYLRGEGVRKSAATGYAWLKLAADAKHPAAMSSEAELRPAYGEDAAGIVADLEARFGLTHVRESRLPEILPNCEYSERTPARLVRQTRVAYPADAQFDGAEGWMTVEFSIAPDGTARDYTVLSSNAADLWRGAIEQAMREWRWEPAMRAGAPVWSRTGLTFRFDISDEKNYRIDKWIEGVKTKAEAGDPVQQYLYAIVLTGHPQLKRPWSDGLPWIERAALSGFALAEYHLGVSLLDGRGCTADREKALYWLQRAAAKDVAEAQYLLALEMAEDPAPVRMATTPIDLLRKASATHRPAKLALARALATGPEVTTANMAEAVSLSAEALKRSPRDPAALEAHAAALATAGRFDEAIKHQQSALRAAESRGWALEPMQRRLTAYQRREPWRGPMD